MCEMYCSLFIFSCSVVFRHYLFLHYFASGLEIFMELQVEMFSHVLHLFAIFSQLPGLHGNNDEEFQEARRPAASVHRGRQR